MKMTTRVVRSEGRKSFFSTDRSIRVSIVILLATALMLFIMGTASWADTEEPPESDSADLTEMSLEDLVKVEVLSLSRRSTKLFESNAAAFVITQEDIRRSGLTSIAELFRMVPGMDVAHINSNTWAVSSRGFNERFSKMLLVMIDGRTVYTPLFSGVFWDVQDTVLEDIERIEVVRGPGASLWGANAVNGIVNIVTKNAADTQGTLVNAVVGTREHGLASVRVGGALRSGSNYRVYLKGFDRHAFRDSAGRNARDAWKQARGGFRIDSDPSENDGSWTVQGDAYTGKRYSVWRHPSLTPPYFSDFVADDSVSGQNVLGRVSRRLSEKSDMSLQVYFDRTKRDSPQIAETRNTVDLDFQHRISLNAKHDLMWGLGYRHTHDDLVPGIATEIDPTSLSENLYSAFIQDEIALRAERTWLTLGTKVERHAYTGVEVQPNIRILHRPSEHQTLWAAASEAVRTPSRGERGARIDIVAFPMIGVPGVPDGTTGLLSLMGGSDLNAEKLRAYEVGYRREVTPAFSVDVAGFYNKYRGLRTYSQDTAIMEPDPTPHAVIPLSLYNGNSLNTWGLEMAAKWEISPRWRVAGGYTWYADRTPNSRSGPGPAAGNSEGGTPAHQFNVRSMLDLPHNMEFDVSIYHVNPLYIPDLLTGAAHVVPSYLRTDLRLGWRPNETLSLSLGVQNLFKHRHPEFVSQLGMVANEVPRSFYCSATWEF